MLRRRYLALNTPMWRSPRPLFDLNRQQDAARPEVQENQNKRTDFKMPRPLEINNPFKFLLTSLLREPLRGKMDLPITRSKSVLDF